MALPAKAASKTSVKMLDESEYGDDEQEEEKDEIALMKAAAPPPLVLHKKSRRRISEGLAKRKSA
jgi:hypothetical protein